MSKWHFVKTYEFWTTTIIAIVLTFLGAFYFGKSYTNSIVDSPNYEYVGGNKSSLTQIQGSIIAGGSMIIGESTIVASPVQDDGVKIDFIALSVSRSYNHILFNLPNGEKIYVKQFPSDMVLYLGICENEFSKCTVFEDYNYEGGEDVCYEVNIRDIRDLLINGEGFSVKQKSICSSGF